MSKRDICGETAESTAFCVDSEIQINPVEHAQCLTTTLNLLRKAGACAEGFKRLVAGLGGPSFNHDAPINLLTILEHNGIQDCLWALCATTENCDKVARLMAADFAEAVLPIFERDNPGDLRPRAAIRMARQFALGIARAAAWDAAWDAASAAAWAAARAAARDAASAAARAAASAAARDAAWDAARDAAWDAASAAQTQIVRRYLLASEPTLPEA